MWCNVYYQMWPNTFKKVFNVWIKLSFLLHLFQAFDRNERNVRNRKQFSLWQQRRPIFANSMLRDRQGFDQGNYGIRQSSPFSSNISFSEQFKTVGLIFRRHPVLGWDTDINLLPYVNLWWRCEELKSCISNFRII